MADKDDQDWTSALAGKAPADTHSATLAEAQAVRQAILETERQKALPELDTDSGLQRLLFRLRQHRLLDSQPERKFSRSYAALAAAACLVVTVAVVLLQSQDQVPDELTFRGGPDEPQVLASRDPAKLVAQMVADLERLGIAPQVTQFGGTTRLEGDWPQKPDARHSEFLRRYHLSPPSGMRLRIEVRRRG